MIYRFAKWLERVSDKILSRYCDVCGKKLILYPDGNWDCTDIITEEKIRRGMRA